MRRILLLISLCLGALTGVLAQSPLPLSLVDARTESQPDGFGGEMLVARGALFNQGAEAYGKIRLFVEVYDAAEELIGEGFGYLEDACGTALLDYALPPGRSQTFSAPYELFAPGEAARVQIEVDAKAASSAPAGPPAISQARQISADEVVMLEWLDNQTLIYGVGCDGDVFTELEWRRHNLANGATAPTEHPDAARVTPQMLELADITLASQADEQDPDLYYTSHLTYSPTARRVVYQNDLNSVYSAEPDGTYRRVIHRFLHQFSLRGFVWARNPGVFLAYYYGAYGEPVHYFTAHVDGQMLSAWLRGLPPSVTVPGPAPDGYAAVVGRAGDDVSGYYWQQIYGAHTLLFAAELPGNNYPAPVVTRTQIFVVRDIDGVPTLQCYGRGSGVLHTVSALPLRLTRESRAWAWLSPDGRTLALGASGVDGGLWLLDVAGACA